MTRSRQLTILLSASLFAIVLVGSLPSASAASSHRSKRTGSTTTTIAAPLSAPATTTTTHAPPPPSTTTTTVAPAPNPSGFVHPGVHVGRADLDFVRAKIAAGQEPWKSALATVLNSGGSIKTAVRPSTYRYSSLSYPPAAFAVVQAPSSDTQAYIDAHPELGLKEMGSAELPDDARAAYTHALLWAYTGNTANANKAIEIMNAWSSKLTEIKFDQPRRTDNNSQVWANGKLVAGWSGTLFARAGEIIRYSGAGWSTSDVSRFENMLHNVHRPLTITGWSSGANWLMTLAEATINIGVFTNNRATFDAGVAYWRQKAPTTIYIPADGAWPKVPNSGYSTEAAVKALWYNPTSFVSGLQGETLRDMSHMTMGLGAMANAAQTAGLQGIDLFREEQARFVAGFERNARWINEYLDKVASLGGAAPPSTWLPAGWVGSKFNLGGVAYRSGWEVAYANYAAKGVSMPETQRLVPRLRPGGPSLHLSWETLTHARS